VSQLATFENIGKFNYVSNLELTSILLLLLLLVGLAQILGWIFIQLRQPKVIGEILAGIVLCSAGAARPDSNLVRDPHKGLSWPDAQPPFLRPLRPSMSLEG
jgi:Kef-type K+ transport system membrane component KefB